MTILSIIPARANSTRLPENYKLLNEIKSEYKKYYGFNSLRKIYNTKKQQLVYKDMHNLYVNKNTNFRGFRQS